ncbi:MAG TPA: F0F1 ATP synthase subunit B [Candidatus Polarisedimenticolia bacterium]|nr:F0F1 ATP synthase subunit B [Candidatus Polarisedimenticolia bacterium]
MGARLITPDFGTIFWTVVTFVILAFLLGKFAWKPLLQLLEERERTIREALEGARAARAETEETLRKGQEVLAGARRDTAAIIEQGKREAESLRGEILAQARKEAQELVEQGKAQVRYEQKQVMEQLRGQVADLAIQAAERLISRSLDDKTQRELVDEYVKSLPAMRREETRS